jgi:signal-transduction protein with cAMP-binding, CBS, and nucleotidyltransferase domain
MKAYFLSLFESEHEINQHFTQRDLHRLLAALELSYYSRGTNLDIRNPSIGFVAEGLIKEYRWAAKGRPTFMQFIEKGTTFIYHPLWYNNTCKALEPSWILHIPMEVLSVTVRSNRAVANWVEQVWRIHDTRHALPFFLRELDDPNERIRIFLSECGHYIAYLSIREVSQFMSISELQSRKIFGNLL